MIVGNQIISGPSEIKNFNFTHMYTFNNVIDFIDAHTISGVCLALFYLLLHHENSSDFGFTNKKRRFCKKFYIFETTSFKNKTRC